MAIDSKDNAKIFVEEIRKIIDQHTQRLSKEKICEIDSVNEDGTLNVYIENDMSNVVHNVVNESRYNFKKGDRGYIYLIGGKLSNSFVFAKCSPKYSDQPQFDVDSIMDEVDSKIRSFVQNINITPTPTPTPEPEGTAIVLIEDSGDVVIDLSDNTDYTLTSNNITSITINIPASVGHGFHCGLNFKNISDQISLIINNSASRLYPTKLICNSIVVEEYNPTADTIAQSVIMCDGLCVAMYLNEV